MADTTAARSVREHYDRMLGPVYSWIIGDFETARRRNAELLASLGLHSDGGASAIDLGCGPGCQAIPLAQAGFRVIAIDFCNELLTELKSHAGDLPIRTVRDDILNFADHLDDSPAVVICMGDTLVHLPDRESVQALVTNVVNSLPAGGTFVASLRDYSTIPPEGPDFFVPVRSSENRIFTCFLQFRDETVDVHDILHTRENGEWRMQVSRYRKLRLDYRRVVELLRELGMTVAAPIDDHGMHVIRATKPR